jgi:hypothetical protein
MTRFSLSTLVATVIVGPWGGCDREPVAPPATPPAERALDADGVNRGGVILIDAAHRRG